MQSITVLKRQTNKEVKVCVTFTVTLAALIVLTIVSIGIGAIWIPPSVVWDSIVSFDASNIHHQLIREVRIPRALTAVITGGALAAAGAIMQGMTRNPLADPSIIGITHGAGLAIAMALVFVATHTFWTLLLFAFGGAAVGAGLVILFSMIAKDRHSPVTLTLAGAALSTLFGALSTGLALYFQVAQDLSFWYAGGLAGSQWIDVWILVPVLVIGFILAMWISRPLTILTMGDEIATGLGQSAGKIRWIGFAAVVMLSGAAVAVAGVIGFIGLMVPHMVRSLIGVDYRLIMPLSILMGAALLVLSDIGARIVNIPFETPVGAITAILGVPFFLYLARRNGRDL
ncbi:FecCD family ABC transporter permease [Jeotgalibacillus aurantiacus]|uniref:FecCD family ABC transporter permease n=1 Tax=Jeotgalibacillus aurantiacus TaxID=2763266 RepID=UPI001D0A92CA|nr:iron ABC transporter permease [Jeotgalibacillus aurantiacus]